MQNMTINKTGLTLDGRDFYLASGDMHYFRVHPSEWRRRLEMMRDFGLTAVQTYCPWNLHEPTEGQYDFSGMLDLSRFLETAQSVGLRCCCGRLHICAANGISAAALVAAQSQRTERH